MVGNRRVEIMKTQPGFSSIDEYIRRFPPPVQKKLTELRTLVRKLAPGAQETISYQMPCFRLGGNLVYFAAHARHIGFYPTASGVANFEKELQRYEHSRGAIQFPMDEPLPIGLITRIVRFRVAENTAAAGRKPARKTRSGS
jgi:uncharacterized protein YdhG (YjbR/CyaY superfamily)